jgi:hypothetical protein
VNWRQVFRVFNITLGSLLLLTTIINISALLHRTSVPKGILFSVDNDAGRAIQTAQLSRWYNSNHFAPYGNLYFRLAHTIAKLAPVEIVQDLNPTEKDEVVHHFALKLASLFSISILCLLLAWILTRRWEFAIGLSAIFLRCFMHDDILVKYIFRAHPDHMLMLATAVASYFTFQYLNDRSQQNYKLSAIFWGIGFAVKRSLVLFIPSLFVMFLMEGLNKASLIKGLKFAGWMLASYLIIGFPQNFGFVKHINFMLSESHNSVAADSGSVLWYCTLIWNQVKFFLIPILIAHLFWGQHLKRKIRDSLIFVAIAMGVLLARKMMSGSEHHTFPHSGMILVLVVFLVQMLPVVRIKYSECLFALTLIIISYFHTGNTHAVSKVFVDQNNCIKESFEFLAIVKREQAGSKIMARDPYVPFDSSRPELTRQFWGLTFKSVEESQASLIGTHRPFGMTYLTPPPDFLRTEDKASWPDRTQFYEKFTRDDKVTTPSGKIFERIYGDRCGFEIWKRKSP